MLPEQISLLVIAKSFRVVYKPFSDFQKMFNFTANFLTAYHLVNITCKLVEFMNFLLSEEILIQPLQKSIFLLG